MQSDTQPSPVSKGMLWPGWIMNAPPSLFLLVDGGMKLAKPAVVVQSTVQLGYPESVIVGLGIVLLSCTVIYLISRTSVLGAILLTGYLGGAVATHVRVEDGLFEVFFPVIISTRFVISGGPDHEPESSPCMLSNLQAPGS